jgi:colanic acid/amylovoran biosynthesis glycosyltransferase
MLKASTKPMADDLPIRIAYLLHRFPGHTDTFIRREIKAIRDAGTHAEVISVWTPKASETTPVLMDEWRSVTSFLIPVGPFKVLSVIAATALRSPDRFLRSLRLAWSTAKPGVKGMLMQAAYFIEAVLAADIAKQKQITHLHNHIGDQSGTVAMLAAELLGIGYSITFHGWPVFFDAENTKVGEKVRRARFTRSISHFCRSQLMLFSKMKDSRPFRIAHCGIEIGSYVYRKPGPEVKQLLCVARISFEKGLSFLVDAVGLLKSRGLDVRLVLAGDGPDRGALEALVRELGLANHVTFLGFQTEAQVRDVLAASDVFVLPSYVEGVPVSAMEAMAVGVPVIATNVGGTSELIEDGHSGLLIRPSDAESICNAVMKLNADPKLAEKLSRNGRAKVEAEFDSAVEFAKLNGFFQEYGAA